ncbi:MAG: TolC family protein [Bacteroidetes bacterium]|nr:TolC family protein [Bacteroidota bacterium]
MKYVFIFISFLVISAHAIAQRNTLSFFIENAKTNSPLLTSIQYQQQLNSLDSLLLLASLKPQVKFSSINSYAPVIGGFGYDNAITNVGNFATLIGINKELISRKTLSANLENFKLHNDSLTLNYTLTEHDLKRTISEQYINAFGSGQQFEETEKIVNLLINEEKILRVLTQKNIYKQTEYLTFLVTMQQQQLQLSQDSIQYVNDLSLLRYLTGIKDTDRVDLTEPFNLSYQEDAIIDSVFIKQFTLDSLLLRNTKSLVDASYAPKISVYGDAGFNSTFAYSAYKNFGISAGISLEIPISDGGQKKITYEKIDLAEKQRIKNRDFFFNQYSQQINSLQKQLKSTENLITQINNQLKYAETLIKANEKLLQTGEVSIADFILALQNHLSINNLLTQNRITRMHILNQINYWVK